MHQAAPRGYPMPMPAQQPMMYHQPQPMFHQPAQQPMMFHQPRAGPAPAPTLASMPSMLAVPPQMQQQMQQASAQFQQVPQQLSQQFQQGQQAAVQQVGQAVAAVTAAAKKRKKSK